MSIKPSTFSPLSNLFDGTLIGVRRGKSKKGNPYIAYTVEAIIDGVRGSFGIYENLGETSYLTGKLPGLRFQWSMSVNPATEFESYQTFPHPEAPVAEPAPSTQGGASPDSLEQVHEARVEANTQEHEQGPKRYPNNLLKVALMENVIKQHGSWFSFDSLLKANGEKAAILKLADDAELYDIVKKAVETAKASAKVETVEQEELIK